MPIAVGAAIGCPKTLDTAKTMDLPCQTHCFEIIAPFGRPMVAPTVVSVVRRSPAQINPRYGYRLKAGKHYMLKIKLLNGGL